MIPLKPAPDQNDSAQVIETTTRRRVLPIEHDRALTFWEYVTEIDTKREWDKHIIYIYRDQPSRFPITKCGRMLRFNDGYEIPIFDQEEVEGNLARRCGGGKYQFICKRGSSIYSNLWLELGTPPKSPAEVLGAFGGIGAIAERGPSAAGGTVPITSTDGTVQIAAKAIDTVASADREAIRVAIDTLTANANLQASTAATIRNLAANPTPPPAPAPTSETDQMLKMLMLKMMERTIDRMDAPASNNSPIVNQLVEGALKRLLEPMPVGNGGTISAGAELVRTLPSVAGYVVDGLREWRMGMEAQRDGVAIMRSPAPPNAPAPRVTPPPSIAQVLPPPPQPRPNPTPAPGGAPSIEFVESRIVEIIRQPISPEEAADRALEFLDTVDGENPAPGNSLVAQLVSAGAPGLKALFETRPILRPVTANPSRLEQFIEAFLSIHAKDQAEEINGKKPN